jgi:hypothetical protein
VVMTRDYLTSMTPRHFMFSSVLSTSVRFAWGSPGELSNRSGLSNVDAIVYSVGPSVVDVVCR